MFARFPQAPRKPRAVRGTRSHSLATVFSFSFHRGGDLDAFAPGHGGERRDRVVQRRRAALCLERPTTIAQHGAQQRAVPFLVVDDEDAGPCLHRRFRCRALVAGHLENMTNGATKGEEADVVKQSVALLLTRRSRKAVWLVQSPQV